MIGTSLGLLESLSKEAGSNEGLRVALGKAYLRLGDLQGGPDAVSMVDFPAAIRTYRAGVAVLEAAPPANMRGEHAMVWLELKWKMARLIGQRDAAGATTILLQVMAASGKLPAAQLAEREFARSRAALFLVLARINHIDLPRARVYAPAYLNAITKLMERDPNDPGLRYDLSVAQVELGWVWLTSGDLEAAAGYYEKAIHIRERLVREFPTDTLYRRALLLAYEHFGDVQGGPVERNLGNPGLARIYYQKARPMTEAAIAADPQNLDALASYASSLVELASVDAPDDAAGSIAALRRAVSIFDGLPVPPSAGPYGTWIATAYRLIADRMASRGDYAGAVKEYQRSIAVADAVLADHPDRDALRRTLEAEAGLASALSATRDRTGALDHAGRMLQRAQEGAKHGADAAFVESWLAQGKIVLANVYRAFDEWAPAQNAAEEALKTALPLSTGRAWDSNTKIVRAAQELISTRRN
jgi:tetratricopeptide (TPR) repeat protein